MPVERLGACFCAFPANAACFYGMETAYAFMTKMGM